MSDLTKSISWREYIGQKDLPYLLNREDIMKYLVNKECDEIISDEELYPVPPPEYVVKQDKTWNAGWYNFFKGLLP